MTFLGLVWLAGLATGLPIGVVCVYAWLLRTKEKSARTRRQTVVRTPSAAPGAEDVPDTADDAPDAPEEKSEADFSAGRFEETKEPSAEDVLAEKLSQMEKDN